MQEQPVEVLNTFSGFEATKTEIIEKDIENSLIIKHIKNLCNNDDNVYNYVIKFLARKLIRAHILTNTILI